ncbi:aminotransferase class V-fold PLP-dependent enzyme [Streptomyces sp. L7]
MIEVVEMDRTTFLPPPQRFEGGRPDDLPGGGAPPRPWSIWRNLGMAEVAAHEDRLTARAAATAPGGARRHGSSAPATSPTAARPVSFTVDGIHPHDVGQILDERGVAVRVGHHCARPIVRRYGIRGDGQGELLRLQHPGRGRCPGRGRPRSSRPTSAADPRQGLTWSALQVLVVFMSSGPPLNPSPGTGNPP